MYKVLIDAYMQILKNKETEKKVSETVEIPESLTPHIPQSLKPFRNPWICEFLNHHILKSLNSKSSNPKIRQHLYTNIPKSVNLIIPKPLNSYQKSQNL